MSKIRISLPDELKVFVEQQVETGRYASSSEYVRALLRRERDREKLRNLLLDGMNSPLTGVVADRAYFDGLRAGIRQRAKQKAVLAAQGKAAARSADQTGVDMS